MISRNTRFVSISSIFAIVVFPSLANIVDRGPRMRIYPRQMKAEMLTLPSNATSIRENITDNFSCDDKSYGYYADVENDCQIFHVCLPVVFSSGKNQTFKWSFICPEETIFNQEVFVCVREEDSSIKCEDSEDFYILNDNFGDKEVEEENMDMEGNSEGFQMDDQARRPMNKDKQKMPDNKRKPKM